MKECCFNREKDCGALTVKVNNDHCRCCTFRKSKKEFEDGKLNSEKMLNLKGLVPIVKTDDNGKLYQSVKKVL